MRIPLIHQAFVGPGEAGGTRYYELGRRCVQRGHDFTVVASSVSYLSGKRVAGNERGSAEEFDGVRVLRSYAPETLHRSFPWRIVAFLSFMVSAVATALLAEPTRPSFKRTCYSNFWADFLQGLALSSTLSIW